MANDDASQRLFFFHGLESGPHGSKYGALNKALGVTSPDFQNMGIFERLDKAIKLTEGATDLVVVGSSYGGLLASLLYDRHPERFTGYVLMAPALHREEANAIESAPAPGKGVIIHGVSDEIVPVDASRDFAAKHGLELIEVEDTHRLAGQHDLMCEHARRLLELD